jgi:polyisoprenoid-binding protein YceI
MNPLYFFLLTLCLSFPLIAKELCFFSYDPSQTKLGFAAFKFSEKARVEGGFERFEVLGQPRAKSLEEFARKVKFRIDVNSVNSGNPERDGKIKKFFFGEMKGSSEITGYFRNIKVQDDIGTGELILKMNLQEKSLPIQFSFIDGKLQLKGLLDVLNWNARSSIEALNKECNALHTGSDGVSKLWSEVEVFLTTTIKTDCK